jgi:hypothetical protein
VKLKVTGNPNQTVALDANGVAQFSYKGLVGDPAGKPYSVGATYGGDGANTTDTGYAVSTASATFDVSPAASVITSTWPTTPAPLYVLLGSTNLLTINVSSLVGGTPTGTVNVMNGATILETVTLDGNGNAQYNTSGLAGSRVPAKLGTYNLTIVYSGDQNYATTSYNLPTFEVIPTRLLITSDPASLTTTAGVAVTATLTLQPLVTFTSTDVQFLPGCVITSLPQNAYCTFDVTTLQFYSSSPQTIHVTVSTNVPVNSGSSAALRKGPAPWALAGIFGFGLVGLAFGKKTRFNGRALTILCLVLLLAGSVFSVTACTNGSYTHTPAAAVAVTPAGTTNIIIQATDSNGTVISLPFTLPITVQ